VNGETENTETGGETQQAGCLASAVAWLTWLYVAGLVAVWMALRFGGDDWWLATLMLFGPRWVYVLPMLVLIPAVLCVRRRLIFPLVIGLVILLWPIMGMCLPWRSWSKSDGKPLRVMTFNVQLDAVGQRKLLALLERVEPDIVAVQECGRREISWPRGWDSTRVGRLEIGSRYPLRDRRVSRRRDPSSRNPTVNALAAVVETPRGDATLVNVHLRTPRRGIEPMLEGGGPAAPSRAAVLSEEISFRRREAEQIRAWLDDLPGGVIVVGDFNMPVDSTIYRRSFSDFQNAFGSTGLGFGHTKQSSAFGCAFGARIDHILTGPGWAVGGCRVGEDIGSDHLPLIADLYREDR